MRALRGLTALGLGGLLGACGGSSSPVGPEPPAELHTVLATVFYDQDADGVPDPDELTRLGSVEVYAANGASTVSERLTGQATLTLPAGSHTLHLREKSLPAFFVSGEAVAVEVPVSDTVYLPARLPIGANRPGVYLAVGDSITKGGGSSDRRGYVGRLEDQLLVEFAQATLVNEGTDGGKSNQGAERIGPSLRRHHPAYVLIMYGTNDWNKCKVVSACYTQDALRSIVRQVRGAESLPLLATIPPANTDFDFRAPPQRNEWVVEMNADLRTIAEEEGALLVDVHAAMMEAAGADLAALFVDHVHPNDRGHQAIAEAFFQAIVTPPTQTLSGTTGGHTPAPWFPATQVIAPAASGPATGGDAGLERVRP